MGILSYLEGRLVRPLRQNEALLILSVSTVFVMSGQGITSPVLPLYARSFGVGATLVGLTISVFGLARMLLNVPAGYAADLLGRRLLLVGGPSVTAVASVLSGLAPDIWQLLVWRFVAGVGSAFYMTGAVIVLTDISTRENRGRFMGVQQGSLLLGVSLGPALGGVAAELWGLRAPFFAVAVLSAVAAGWSLRIAETGRMARSVGPQTGALAPGRPGVGRGAWLPLLGNLNYLLVGLVTFNVFFTRTGSQLSIVPLLAENRIGLGAGALGGIFTMMSVINLLAIFPSGSLVDRMGRKPVIVPAALVSGLGLALFAVSGDVAAFVAAAVVLAVGMGLAGPAPAAYAADIAPEHARGVAMGLYRTFGDVGFVAGPLVLGWVADASSFGVALTVNAGLMLAGAVLFWAFAREADAR